MLYFNLKEIGVFILEYEEQVKTWRGLCSGPARELITSFLRFSYRSF